MTWLGVDDTDSRAGGCTTFVMTEIIHRAVAAGFDLVGAPRLVRLNPNIPYKTRGNAALSARFGHGQGRTRNIGSLPQGQVHSFETGTPLSPGEEERLFSVGWNAVLESSSSGESRADPALVLARNLLPARLYWAAVREVVAVSAVERELGRIGARWHSEGTGQGLVGAAAAIAWPSRKRTWEILAYREPARIALPREVDPAGFIKAARRYPSLFLSSDPRTRRLMVTPHTPCPILYGVRSRRPETLMAARGLFKTEPVERWLLFETNQATGDHLVHRPVRSLGPYLPAQIQGALVQGPKVGRGGHVTFAVADAAGDAVTCIVFEPTKTLPPLAAKLGVGDRVRVDGGCGSDSTFRVEAIEVLRLATRWSPAHAPHCPGCKRRMDSAGSMRGYRCRSCRLRAPPEMATRHRIDPPIRPGRYDPTPSARRHLHPRRPE